MNQNVKLKPLNSNIKVKFTIKGKPEQGVKTSHHTSYEDFGEWLCRVYTSIYIIDISDK